jgi:hypothetical protein
MPAIEAKTLGHIVVAITTNCLGQAAIRRAEFGIVRFRNSKRIPRPGIEVVRPAKVIFSARSADRGIARIAIHVELDLSFAPPAVVVDAPGQVSANILSLTAEAVEQHIVLLVRQGVGTTDLSMKVHRIVGNLREDIIHLVVKRHRFRVDVLESDPTFVAEGHGPIPVEGTPWIHTNYQALNWRIAAPAHVEKVADRRLYARRRFSVSVKAEN